MDRSRLLLAVLVLALAIGGYIKNGDGSTGSADRAPAVTTDAVTTTPPAATDSPTPRASATTAAPKRSAPLLNPERALGQTLAGSYAGTTPPRSLLDRIRRGQVGSVILFAANVAGGVPATRRAVDRMQQAAKDGGHPKLLVMTDQEGGLVKRIPGPPTVAPAQMSGVVAARREGAAAGRLLRRAGVNLDLAPVADVKRVRGSFLSTRAFPGDETLVAQRACAFAAGLRSEGVGAVLKHFPGLGRASGNTDDGRITVTASAAQLREDYAPYARCAGAPRTGVMMSSATYPALTGKDAPAVLSRATYARELGRARVPDRVMTISDDLDAAALAGRDRPAHRALTAGLDLLLYAGRPESSAAAYPVLLAELKSGALPVSRVREAATAVLALKAALP